MKKRMPVVAALAAIIVSSSLQIPAQQAAFPAYEVSSQRADVASPRTLALKPDDRVIIFSPHPDDESLGCAGVIQQALAMKLPVRVVWLTYGDNNELSFILYRKHLVIEPSAERAMGEVRHDEAVAAMKALGVPEEELAFLGYPDFGTLDIWYEHWGYNPSFRSMLTKVSAVPYANAFRPGAPYKGEEIVRDIAANLRAFRPTKVFVSHPSDLNVDHQALYLYVRAALWELDSEIRPQLFPFLIHCSHWPAPAGLHPQESLMPPARIADPVDWLTFPLNEEQRMAKKSALQAHRSQMAYSKGFMLSFDRANELFGDFPTLHLAAARTDTPAGTGLAADTPGLHAELTETERAKFVGLEQVHVWRETNDLVVEIGFSRSLVGPEVTASVHAFGYRSDLPFAAMPKLRVMFGEVGHRVLEQTRELPADTVQFRRQPQQITVRIPLETMGHPERALFAVHTYLALDALDWAEWRVIELGRSP
jgi:LmbE family N-acetylglucosaminyl deacetylase